MPAPANIYENDVDFTSLALRYPDFAKRLKPNRQLDFSDPESVRQLTKSLLHRDFDLVVDLPEDRLCPPVPNRFNYILFMQRLLDCTSPDFSEEHDPEREVFGIDIGTGASAIYPLLACRQRPTWRMLYTELDAKNSTYAARNISTNNLNHRIRALTTDPTGDLLIPTANNQLSSFSRIDFLLTNPPFHDSPASLLSSAKQKSRPPNSSCTGAAVEMITPGGEVAFVAKLIAESSALGSKIQWFSAMLGKLSSVGTIVETLRRRKCTNHVIAEFIQGQKTRRWCVAWSWMGFRPSNSVARCVGGGSGVERKFLPPPTESEFDVVGMAVQEVVERVGVEIKKLRGVQSKFDHDRGVVMLMSREGDVWSRKARRKITHPRDTEMKDSEHASFQNHDDDDDSSDGEEDDEEEKEPALVVKISIRPSTDTTTTTNNNNANTNPESSSSSSTIRIRHLQGHDSVLFESFCGWLKRKITAAS